METTMTVWVDSWQMQCCGDPFAVGSAVSWQLTEPDRDWLTDVLGDRTVDAAEEHHGDATGPAVTATVTDIQTVHCRYGPVAGSEGLCPVAGSGVLTEVNDADGWVPDRAELTFVGYLVRLRPQA